MRQTLETKKKLLLDGLVEARRGILESVRLLPDRCMDEIFLGSWSVKDLIAHLVGWDYTNLQAIREIQAGQVPSFFQYYDKDWQSYNHTLVGKYRIEPFGRLLAEADQSHRELLNYLETLSPGIVVEGKASRENRRSVTIQNLLRAEAGDEAKHAEQIKAYFHLTESSNREVPDGQNQ